MLEVLVLSMVKTFAVIKIKNGFINSIGWNLKKYKSSHRLDPLTSIPINGTSTNKIREIMKIGICPSSKKAPAKKSTKKTISPFKDLLTFPYNWNR